MEKQEKSHVDSGPSAIEVPLTPEQYQKLRAWFDSNDVVEVVTDSSTHGALLLNQSELWDKNHPGAKQEFGGKMSPVRVQVFSPFIDFIKQYLAFFGDKSSLEDFCQVAVYDKVRTVHGSLTALARSRKNAVNSAWWFEKWPVMLHECEGDEETDC
jgi:hypothetical protein